MNTDADQCCGSIILPTDWKHKCLAKSQGAAQIKLTEFSFAVCILVISEIQKILPEKYIKTGTFRHATP